MTRRTGVLFWFFSLLLVSVLPSSVRAEVLFGPVTVTGGQTHTATFPMYCRCTAYFLEMRNVSTEGMRSATIRLNGQVVMEVGDEWTKMSRQVELAETEPNEIEIAVLPPAGAGVTVRVYERDVTPAPMEGREYAKERGPRKWERFGERFILNHWASRFHLRVENGDPDGSHRVRSGQVWVNGAEVIGTGQLHSGVGSVSVEVELQEGENDVQALLLLGPTGSKIRLGIEEPAQTVTVTEVAEVKLPGSGPHEDGISTHDGQILYRGHYATKVVEIDGSGAYTERFAGSESTWVHRMSPRGSYVWVMSVQNGVPQHRLYDWTGAVVADWPWSGTAWNIYDISEAGNTLVGPDYPANMATACSGGSIFSVYDVNGTRLGQIQGSPYSPPRMWVSPDGMTVAAYCGNTMSVYTRDGALMWEAPYRGSPALAAGGRAVQATEDSLLMHGPDGGLERVVVSSHPQERLRMAWTTDDGQFAAHGGRSVMVTRRWGPQSCWDFYPDVASSPCLSEGGKWLVLQGGRDEAGKESIWLVGLGAQLLWERRSVSRGYGRFWNATDGGFHFIEVRGPHGLEEWCHLFRIDVE